MRRKHFAVTVFCIIIIYFNVCATGIQTCTLFFSISRRNVMFKNAAWHFRSGGERTECRVFFGGGGVCTV